MCIVVGRADSQPGVDSWICQLCERVEHCVPQLNILNNDDVLVFFAPFIS